ncbi:sterol desaturase family protein [Caenimonas aquaedulcis]|uniref:Sterol desaturase family protein n=1 Tax=Caenimonas aquaedulcis TaxID=2793270 RepID=A0A931MG60_9BURK|nr:sterol desaturase family protein [Caenimonas aquaedulcis]MBG9387752.1 sterol desaturase family protein [Caenimonas aquaedulcis]
MNATQNLILVAIILGFAAAEFISGRYRDFHATADDGKLELFMFVSLVAFTQPFIFAVVGKAGELWFPQWRGAWAGLPWWMMAAILLVGDDMTQYWWHRVSHTPMLWPLHRAHHTAHYMSLRITYRNNFFYYLMMPGLWVSGALIYLGFGDVYLAYVIVKLTVIMGAHSAVRWDEPLYRIKALSPLMWVVERTISTPATHWAHHALTNTDGVGHYTGNFGNLLFFWDVLFGTAHITRRYPEKVGLQDDLIFGKERWFTEMFYPLLRSRREHSALTPGGKIYAEAEADAGAPPHAAQRG